MIDFTFLNGSSVIEFLDLILKVLSLFKKDITFSFKLLIMLFKFRYFMNRISVLISKLFAKCIKSRLKTNSLFFKISLVLLNINRKLLIMFILFLAHGLLFIAELPLSLVLSFKFALCSVSFAAIRSSHVQVFFDFINK